MGRYFAELDRRFATGFDPGAGDDPALYRPPHGTFVVARSDGDPVACGGVQPLGEGTAEIKRMWVHDDWRGAGLGARMLRRARGRRPRLRATPWSASTPTRR